MKRLLAVVTVVGAVLLGQMAPAAAQTGTQTFTIFGFDDEQTVFASGVASGFPSVNVLDEETDEYVFDGGSFRVHHPETDSTFEFNELTCIGTGEFEGTFTLSQGSGDYAGISGSGTYTGRFFFLAERDDEGNCLVDEQPAFSFFQVRATGTATLP